MRTRPVTSLIMIALSGCVTPQPKAPSFATGYDVPESDGILINWHGCTDHHPCMTGEYEGERFELGFLESPAVVTGSVGGRPVRFDLDPTSVYRLGDHAIDLLFTNESRDTALSLTWNELEQRPIDVEIVPASRN